MVTIKIFGTPIKIKPGVMVNIVALWVFVSWLELIWYPQRSIWQSLLVGIAGMLLLLVADFGHAIAHIFSARYAGAPMDEVLISGSMPRTRYFDNAVPPKVHRIRSLGGPVFSALGTLVSGVVFAASPGGSIAEELAKWSLLGHGFILLGSLLPLPIVDGGTLLKWTLVGRGKTESQADEIVLWIDRVMGMVGVITGIGLLLAQEWIAGLVLVGGGVLILLIATGKIN